MENGDIDIKVDSVLLQTTNEIKYLRLFVDDRLSYCQSETTVGDLLHAKNLTTTTIELQIYNSFINTPSKSMSLETHHFYEQCRLLH